MTQVLVTGCAGFIGFHASLRLLREGHTVIGVDNLSDYYDVSLKEARRAKLADHPRFSFHRLDLSDASATASFFAGIRPDWVLHMAAQAGVRLSLTQPRAYLDSNLSGFLNVLEGCRDRKVAHLVYASSSSVYGLNATLPFSVHQPTEHPLSFYAATKKANELMAHSYSHLFGIPTTGLRLFTVYGPWGRPDMALFSFTRSILAGTPITVFGDGSMRRDFTYIDDVVEAVLRVADRPPAPTPSWDGAHPDPATSAAPYRLLNIGNRSPVSVTELVSRLEAALGRKAVLRYTAANPTEVASTRADVTDLEALTGFTPATPLDSGIEQFVAWYRGYYAA
jgi:UDP-glucuronate 4-epimerase